MFTTPRLILLLAVLVGFALGAAGPRPTAAAEDGTDVAPGRLIVKLRPGRSASALRAEAATYGAEDVEESPRLGGQVWRVPAGREAEVARRLAARGDVEYAEPDRIRRTKLTPNDTFYGAYQWNMPKINAPPAWDVTTGDPSVKVAVVDSGFDLGHPDRPASLQVGCDYVRWRSSGLRGACPTVSDDQNGHGTHVAGIVAARQNNGLGISGVAPNVTLLAIRTADRNGSSYVSDVAAAIREATDAGARVINLSLGGSGASQTESNAVSYALSRGVVVVAAAGNEYSTGNARTYPAAFAGVIAVGSASDDDEHAYFSNTGSYLSLVAPGGSATSGSDGDVRHWIASLYPLSQGGYQLVEGTSQASPHVAAVAGLMFSARPGLSGSQAAALLKSTARPIGAPIPNETFGYGYLDANAAVRAAQSFGATASPTPSPTATTVPTAAAQATATRTPLPTATPTPRPTATPWPTATQAPVGGETGPPPAPTARAGTGVRLFIPITQRGRSA